MTDRTLVWILLFLLLLLLVYLLTRPAMGLTENVVIKLESDKVTGECKIIPPAKLVTRYGRKVRWEIEKDDKCKEFTVQIVFPALPLVKIDATSHNPSITGTVGDGYVDYEIKLLDGKGTATGQSVTAPAAVCPVWPCK